LANTPTASKNSAANGNNQVRPRNAQSRSDMLTWICTSLGPSYSRCQV
jgi:hypothetical protein